ncbi:MAG: hypothetical protein KGJ93_03515 [Patescibacteria group bacterium]|nr:hypothetical protein [Patescibacteria group bacterium]
MDDFFMPFQELGPIDNLEDQELELTDAESFFSNGSALAESFRSRYQTLEWELDNEFQPTETQDFIDLQTKEWWGSMEGTLINKTDRIRQSGDAEALASHEHRISELMQSGARDSSQDSTNLYSNNSVGAQNAAIKFGSFEYLTITGERAFVNFEVYRRVSKQLSAEVAAEPFEWLESVWLDDDYDDYALPAFLHSDSATKKNTDSLLQTAKQTQNFWENLWSDFIQKQPTESKQAERSNFLNIFGIGLAEQHSELLSNSIEQTTSQLQTLETIAQVEFETSASKTTSHSPVLLGLEPKEQAVSIFQARPNNLDKTLKKESTTDQEVAGNFTLLSLKSPLTEEKGFTQNTDTDLVFSLKPLKLETNELFLNAPFQLANDLQNKNGPTRIIKPQPADKQPLPKTQDRRVTLTQTASQSALVQRTNTAMIEKADNFIAPKEQTRDLNPFSKEYSSPILNSQAMIKTAKTEQGRQPQVKDFKPNRISPLDEQKSPNQTNTGLETEKTVLKLPTQLFEPFAISTKPLTQTIQQTPANRAHTPKDTKPNTASTTIQNKPVHNQLVLPHFKTDSVLKNIFERHTSTPQPATNTTPMPRQPTHIEQNAGAIRTDFPAMKTQSTTQYYIEGQSKAGQNDRETLKPIILVKPDNFSHEQRIKNDAEPPKQERPATNNKTTLIVTPEIRQIPAELTKHSETQSPQAKLAAKTVLTKPIQLPLKLFTSAKASEQDARPTPAPQEKAESTHAPAQKAAFELRNNHKTPRELISTEPRLFFDNNKQAENLPRKHTATAHEIIKRQTPSTTVQSPRSAKQPKPAKNKIINLDRYFRPAGRSASVTDDYFKPVFNNYGNQNAVAHAA